jgi:hypothetical protein
MITRRIVLVAFVVALAVAFTVPSTHAGIALTRVNQLTFNAPVSLPGVVLLPGRYAFETGPVGTHPDIVRVTSADYQKLYFLGFTQRIPRPGGMGPGEVLALGEAPAGAPTPIRAWFPIGSKTGHEFLYR